MPDPRTPFRTWRGYPAILRDTILSRIGCTLGCLPIVALPLYSACFYWSALERGLRPGPVVGLVLSGLLFLLFASLLCFRHPRPRFLPYFERGLGDTDTFLGGEALARNCRRLDEAAAAHGRVPLTAFVGGREGPFRAAGEGLEAVRQLAGLVASHPGVVDDPRAVLEELGLIEDALSKAHGRGVGFCLHVRCEDYVVPAEIAALKGSYF
ncbi:MAG: hypothetical protein IT452_12065 [Planctomycetia bacterium]|nr:hypothetical protein [Planctomycetia bacterium]